MPLIFSGIYKGINDNTFFIVELTTILFFVFMYKIVDESKKTFMSTITQAIEISTLNDEKASMIEEKEMRSNFFASVSHEIRTPLNGIFGLLEVLKDSDLSSEQEEHIDTIKHVSYDLLKVINYVLDLFNDVYRLYQGKAIGKGIDLKLEIDNSLPENLVIDQTRFKQILNNIASNAVKFTNQGSISITTKYTSEGVLNVKIQDQGIGIEEDKIDKIFDRYEQIKGMGTLKQKVTEKGTGLGLSISKELIMLMKGSVKVSSEVGVGTLFDISIPFEIGEVSSSDLP